MARRVITMTMSDLEVEKGKALIIARQFVTERTETYQNIELYMTRCAELAEIFDRDELFVFLEAVLRPSLLNTAIRSHPTTPSITSPHPRPAQHFGFRSFVGMLIRGSSGFGYTCNSFFDRSVPKHRF